MIVDYLNTMKINARLSSLIFSDLSASILTVNFLAQNYTHKSSFEYVVPINFSPRNGSIGVEPTSGAILAQIFKISAVYW